MVAAVATFVAMVCLGAPAFALPPPGTNISIISAGPTSGNPYQLTVQVNDLNGLQLSSPDGGTTPAMTVHIMNCITDVYDVTTMAYVSGRHVRPDLAANRPDPAGQPSRRHLHDECRHVRHAGERSRRQRPGAVVVLLHDQVNGSLQSNPPTVTAGSQNVTFTGTRQRHAQPVGRRWASAAASPSTSRIDGVPTTRSLQPTRPATSATAASTLGHHDLYLQRRALPAPIRLQPGHHRQGRAGDHGHQRDGDPGQCFRRIARRDDLRARDRHAARVDEFHRYRRQRPRERRHQRRTNHQVNTTDAAGDFSYPAGSSRRPPRTPSASPRRRCTHRRPPVPVTVQANPAPSTITVNPSPAFVTFGSRGRDLQRDCDRAAARRHYRRPRSERPGVPRRRH